MHLPNQQFFLYVEKRTSKFLFVASWLRGLFTLDAARNYFHLFRRSIKENNPYHVYTHTLFRTFVMKSIVLICFFLPPGRFRRKK